MLNRRELKVSYEENGTGFLKVEESIEDRAGQRGVSSGIEIEEER